MKSIKPGRGPSAMNVAGSIFSIVFAICWTGLALRTKDIFFITIGIAIIIMTIVNTIYHSKNAFGKKRYSVYDITEDQEEVDPLQERFGQKQEEPQTNHGYGYCPYCGESLENDYLYCPKCGKRLMK